MIIPCINCCRMQICSVAEHPLLTLGHCTDYLPEEYREIDREIDREYLEELKKMEEAEPIVHCHGEQFER